MFLTLSEIADSTKGEILAGDPSSFVGGHGPGCIAIDTRNFPQGAWFIALTGKSGRDGHAYLENAIASGAAGLIISDGPTYEKIESTHPNFPALLVADTTEALADIARACLDKFHPFVIAITGTVGKTSVKEIVAHITSSRWLTLKNQKNWNTEIGVPLTIFDLTPSHRLAVIECASRGLGHIHHLSMIARPDLAVITAIGPGHLSEFGTVDIVAKAKWEIVDGLKPGGKVVVQGKSTYTTLHGNGFNLVTFGMDTSNDFHPADFHSEKSITDLTIETPGGSVETRIHGISRADISNALCATAICLNIEIPATGGIEKLTLDQIGFGLGTFPGIEGREQIIVRPNGIEVIFDAYNSNPMSLANALDALARYTHLSNGEPVLRRVAILGDMLELGSDELKYHREAGRNIGLLPIDCLVTVGKLSEVMRTAAEETRGEPISGAHYANTGALVPELGHWVKPGDLILMKASRAIALESLLKGDW